MTKDMTQGNPFKLILLFAVPMFIGNIFQQFYNMVDAIVVGQFVSTNALAAIGATGSLSFFVLGFAMGMCTGYAIIVAQSFGAKDYDKLRNCVATAVVLTTVLTAAITILSVAFAPALLRFMNTPDDIFSDALIYIRIIFAGITVTMFYNLLSAILRALGDSKTPLYFLIVAAVLNVILDLISVLALGMGVAGVAIATVLSQGISCVLCLFYIKKRHPILHLKKEDFKIKSAMVKRLLQLGIPTAFQTSITALGMMIIQSFINTFGATGVAAYTAGTRVENLVTQAMMTIGAAMATYCGQNMGAGRFDRIRSGIFRGVVLTLAYTIPISLITYFFGGQMTRLFISGNEPQVFAYAKQYMQTIAPFFWILALLFLFRNALQGLGNTTIPFFSGVLELVARILAAVFLMDQFGYFAVCIASPIAWVAAGVLLTVSFFLILRRFFTEHQSPKRE